MRVELESGGDDTTGFAHATLGEGPLLGCEWRQSNPVGLQTKIEDFNPSMPHCHLTLPSVLVKWPGGGGEGWPDWGKDGHCSLATI